MVEPAQYLQTTEGVAFKIQPTLEPPQKMSQEMHQPEFEQEQKHSTRRVKEFQGVIQATKDIILEADAVPMVLVHQCINGNFG